MESSKTFARNTPSLCRRRDKSTKRGILGSDRKKHIMRKRSEEISKSSKKNSLDAAWRVVEYWNRKSCSISLTESERDGARLHGKAIRSRLSRKFKFLYFPAALVALAQYIENAQHQQQQQQKENINSLEYFFCYLSFCLRLHKASN